MRSAGVDSLLERRRNVHGLFLLSFGDGILQQGQCALLLYGELIQAMSDSHWAVSFSTLDGATSHSVSPCAATWT